jgi:ferrous iron transport protein A
MTMHWRRPKRDKSVTLAEDLGLAIVPAGVRRLSEAGRGERGVVIAVSPQAVVGASPFERDELERRLLEIGFVEGARVEILHEGFIRRDPIAVRLDDMRVALRRREAQGVLIRLDAESTELRA